MAARSRYSEADRRGRNSNQDLTNIGVAGRRTGLRVEGARRGSDGFENESAFFSPTTTVKKANAYNELPSAKSSRSPVKDLGSYEDMELEGSASPVLSARESLELTSLGSAQDVPTTLRRRSQGPISAARRRSKSPTKTNLNSPALRIRNHTRQSPSSAKSVLKSPMRPPPLIGSNIKIARKLDFRRKENDDNDHRDEPVADVERWRQPVNSSASKRRHSSAPPLRRRPIEEPADEEAHVELPVDSPMGDPPDGSEQPASEMVLEQDDNGNYDDEPPGEELDEQFNEYIHDQADAEDGEVEASPLASPCGPVDNLATSRPSPVPIREDDDQEPLEIDFQPRNDIENVDESEEQPLDAGENSRPRSSPSTDEEPGHKEQDGEEQEEETAAQRQRKRRRAGKTKETANKKRVAPRTSLSPSRATRERSTRTASPQREWREPVHHNVQPQDEHDGVRKSSRFKIAPLAFWRGEKLVYGRGSRRKSAGGTLGLAMPEVKEIIHVDLIEGEQIRRKGRPAKSSKPRKRQANGQVKDESESESEYDSDHWEEKIVVEAAVPSYEDQNQLVKTTLAIPGTAYEPRLVLNQGIFFQKTLFEGPHFASGILDIPVGAGKPRKPSRANTLFFFIHIGYVEVTIHDVVFRLRKGGQFFIPRANFYEIKNIGKTDARLFFSQSTDTLANLRMEEERKAAERQDSG